MVSKLINQTSLNSFGKTFLAGKSTRFLVCLTNYNRNVNQSCFDLVAPSLDAKAYKNCKVNSYLECHLFLGTASTNRYINSQPKRHISHLPFNR